MSRKHTPGTDYRNVYLTIRVTAEEHRQIKEAAAEIGMKSISEFCRNGILAWTVSLERFAPSRRMGDK